MDRASVKKKALLVLALLLLPCGVWEMVRDGVNSITGLNAVEVVLLVGTAVFLSLLPLSFLDYIFLFAATLFAHFASPYVRYELPSQILLQFALLCALVYGEKGTLFRYGGPLMLTALSSAVTLVLYDALFRAATPVYYNQMRNFSWPVKAVVLLLMGTAAFLTAGAVLRLAGRFLDRWLKKLASLPEKYREIERAVLLFFAFTLLLVAVLDANPFPQEMESRLQPVFLLWLLLLLLFQVFYLRTLARLNSLKERMRWTEEHYETLSRYNRDLESNLDDVRAVRHDIKNLFLTMGGFVERSGDEEMKRFYEESMMPFVRDTLTKSDLLSKLREVRDEALKSFLYYKILEGLEQGVPASLTVRLTDGADFLVERMDLVRLLGIFLDNAIEEARLAGGGVSFDMAEEEGRLVFTVRNATREETRRRGVLAGTTTKGLGRGNGLVIAEKIAAKYDNVLINTYFAGEDYVTQLLVLRDGKE